MTVPCCSIDVFKYDPSYLENEDKYKVIKEEILGEGSSDDSDEEGETGDEEDSDEEEEGGAGEGEMTIKDETQTDLLGLRRTIYLTLMSRYVHMYMYMYMYIIHSK